MTPPLPPEIEALVEIHDARMKARAPIFVAFLSAIALVVPLMFLVDALRGVPDRWEMMGMTLVFPASPLIAIGLYQARKMLRSTAPLREALAERRVLTVTIIQRTVNGIPGARVIELGSGWDQPAHLLSIDGARIEQAAAALHRWVRPPTL